MVRMAWAVMPGMPKGEELRARPRNYGLLACYDFGISSGPSEGANNKIKAMQRAACGYRAHEYFVPKTYGLHKVKHPLAG